MDKATFDQVCSEMEEAIQQMRPEAKQLHELQAGLALGKILDDYRWDWSYDNTPSNQIQAIKDAEPNPDNVQIKIPIWIAEWSNHSIFTSTADDNERFVEEYRKILTALVTCLPTHPSAGRLQRWMMARFDRSKKVFKYDA